jgi:uncharacterized protein (DUF2235 family)
VKRLVVYFDGTWNVPRALTNVHRLCEITAKADEAGVPQVKRYYRGVGTRRLEWLRGGVLGFGTARNIRDAYAWLARTYEDGDQVFVLGFSRGAFSARSLAGMIARCGLLRPDAATSVAEIYRRYAARDEVLAPDSRRIEIHFLGVWDTVGALGVPWGDVPGVSRSTTLFHDTSPSRWYRNMFHALAIDEHRGAYAPALWTAGDGGFTLRPDQRLEQRWFAGSHTDVGGGRHEDAPARIPLAWLQERAAECGLAFTRRVTPGAGDHRLPLADSFATFLHGLYRILRRNRRHYRPIGLRVVRTPAGRTRPLNETIDASVFDRWREDAGYRRRSRNLSGWARARGIEPATVHGTVPARPVPSPAPPVTPPVTPSGTAAAAPASPTGG